MGEEIAKDVQGGPEMCYEITPNGSENKHRFVLLSGGQAALMPNMHAAESWNIDSPYLEHSVRLFS